MHTRLLNIWENFRSSFWFVPSLLMLASVIVAYAMVSIDVWLDQYIVENLPIFAMEPSAARSILAAIVGAMISSTGVVFSMTIVALTLASSQFGSRLVRTFRGRRSTHFTLGIFLATSLYCILVLACIREPKGFSFVPTLAVGVGILLTVICLSALIYYLHDMSYAIQAGSVVEKSATDLHGSINRLFPTRIGDDAKDHVRRRGRQQSSESDASMESSMKKTLRGPILTVRCCEVGYLQAIENESVMQLASKKEVVVQLKLRPGDFIYDGCELADVFQAMEDPELESSDLKKDNFSDELRCCLIVGADRTPTQDLRYAFNELVEVAVRALSPGINDPFTAITCVDRILAALLELNQREPPSPYRFDADNRLRVIAEPIHFNTCVESTLKVIQHYAADSPMVASRVDEALKVTDFS